MCKGEFPLGDFCAFEHQQFQATMVLNLEQKTQMFGA